MSDLLPFLIVGVTAGSLYGLAGLGLVLTFKTSGVFNFAHGALAAAGAYAFYDLHGRQGVPWPLALVASVVGVALIGGVVIERLSRRLATAPVVLSIGATVGLFLAVQGVLNWRYGFDTLQLPAFVKGDAFTIQTVTVSRQSVMGVGAGFAGAALLFAGLRLTRLGASMRAVVDAPELLDLSGTSPARVRTVAWIIGCGFAALTGILIAPSLGLDATLLTLLVVQAFGAAALGRFSSLPLTYLGGILVGVVAALLTKAVSSTPTLVGLPSSIPFLILVVVLVLAPPRSFGASRTRKVRSPGRRPYHAEIGPGGRWPGPRRGGAGSCRTSSDRSCPSTSTPPRWSPLRIASPPGVDVGPDVALSCRFVALGASTFAHLTHGARVPWFAGAVAGRPGRRYRSARSSRSPPSGSRVSTWRSAPSASAS